MKKLVLAEKPSVGRELARVLGCRNCGRYFESGDYVVTWALGHLVTPAPPDHYGRQYRRWTLSDLPILPGKLENIVIEKTKAQFDLVASLLGREDIEGVVIATDAGREGELVARWILEMAGCRKPLQRLWISSQTDMAINEGFANLRPGEEYENLYKAAACRSAADWYVGYNVSRALSCFHDAPLSAGRVQTPTLALIVNREKEIEAFAGSFYWTIRADFGAFSASLFKNGTIKIPSEEEAAAIAAKLDGATGRIVYVNVAEETERPPLAYDLTSLQQDANTLLGFSAKETLDVLQRLYEVRKLVTYPRTDSRHITTDIVPTLGARLGALAATPFGIRAATLRQGGARTGLEHLVDNDLVTDHHAILPTEEPVDLGKLTDAERRLWNLVALRFVEVLSPDYVYKTTTVKAEVEGETFVSRLHVPASLGWRDAGRDIGLPSACALEEDDLEGRIALSLEMREGDELKVVSAAAKRHSSPAPARYTDATLLYAMEHAGKFVDDAEQKKHLSNGLGTPATRADIIEKLIANHCMERDERTLKPTPKGMELVRLAPEQLKSPQLTAVWEERLAAISAGEEDPASFLSDVRRNASDLVGQVVSSKLRYDPAPMGTKVCPFCGWPMMRVLDDLGQVHHVCQRFSCGYEEKEVKVKVPAPAPAAPPKPQMTVRVVASAPKAAGPDAPPAKKKLVIRKPAARKPEEESVWKTTIEVVKESHYHPRPAQRSWPRRPWDGARSADHDRDHHRDHDRDRGGDRDRDRGRDLGRREGAWKGPRQDGRQATFGRPQERSSSSGGTFADFIALQKEREKRDKERRKKG